MLSKTICLQILALIHKAIASIESVAFVILMVRCATLKTKPRKRNNRQNFDHSKNAVKQVNAE